MTNITRVEFGGGTLCLEPRLIRTSDSFPGFPVVLLYQYQRPGAVYLDPADIEALVVDVAAHVAGVEKLAYSATCSLDAPRAVSIDYVPGPCPFILRFNHRDGTTLRGTRSELLALVEALDALRMGQVPEN